MTDTTPNLALPELIASQAQKHVTVNEALGALDALVQLAVLDRDLAVPPASPAEGERWLVAAGAADGWSGHDGAIAAWQNGAWAFYAPRAGWTCYVADEAALLVYDGAAWQAAAGSALQNLGLLGIGTTADAANPLAARLNNALFAARTVAEGGDGTLRYKLSKEDSAKTLSFLFQDNYSGRAEFGLTGDDDFHIKVSPDGVNWVEAVRIDGTNGTSRVQGLAHGPTGQSIRSLLFTPGGDGTVSLWRVDAEHAQNPRTATVSSITGDTVTLTDTVAETFAHFSGFMTGVSYARIWNITKSPTESAWVRAVPTTSTLQILNATDIAGWSSGDVVQIGDPIDVTPGRVIALDISPMLQNLFGTVFPQAGIVVKGTLTSPTTTDTVAITPSGIAGSFVGVGSPGVASGVTIIPCTESSPISNSNLVLVRETLAGTATLSVISSVAVFI
ncbi:MAG: DUF2793 domain-containing protein [Pseudolabrys sp.]|jgi:hypothetical protein|nr:DUF2793 domain-containing protein [Pseudolabrys sp.]